MTCIATRTFRGQFSFRATALVLIAACGGCGEKPAAPGMIDFTLDAAGAQPAADYARLGDVLETGVGGGRLDMKEYRVHLLREPLEAQLRVMAVAGPSATPDLFPDRESRLAWWLNARTAWTIRLAAALDEIDEDDNTASRTPGMFPLDGRRMTLEEIDVEILRAGDYRCVMAAPGLFPLRAPLPAEPFAPETLEEQTRDNFNAFIVDPERFKLDALQRELLVPPVVWRHRDRLKRAYRETFGGPEEVPLITALLPVTTGSAHHRLQNLVGYRCRGVGPR